MDRAPAHDFFARPELAFHNSSINNILLGIYMNYIHKLEELSPVSKKYFSIYVAIILRATTRSKVRKDCLKLFSYVEQHHIFPKSKCNDFEKRDTNNLVFLTLHEHLLCHKILARVFPHIPEFIRAFYAMYSARNKKQQICIMTTRDVMYFKSNSIALQSHPGSRNGMFGKKHSSKTKELIRQKATGRLHSESAKQKMSVSRSGEKNHLYNKNLKDETKQKISETIKRTGSSSGANNNWAKTFIITSPNREVFLVSGEFGKFCKTHNLSIWKMRNSINCGVIYIPPFKTGNRQTGTANCNGWSIAEK